MTPLQLQSPNVFCQRSREANQKHSVGLGLMLVHRLVKRLGGGRLSSEAGRGTTAQVTLPIRQD